MDLLRALNLLYSMQVKEFLNILEKNVIYEVLKDDQIIEKLIYLFKNTNKKNMNFDEIDDNNEIPIISPNTAIASLETIRTFLFQQDNMKEYVKLMGKIKKFFRVKKISLMKQTNINTYFC